MKNPGKIYLMIALMLFIFTLPVYAEESSYEVLIANEENTESYQFNSYENAEAFYLEHFNDGENIWIKREDKIIQARYALVRFSSNASCTVNTDFVMDETNENGYLNGCYGTDGAFLGLNSRQTYAKFLISGAIGWVKLDDIELVLVDEVNTVSSYCNNQGKFTHQIKDSFDNDRFSTVLVLDEALDYLNENTVYFSYDGHYFYEDIKTMLDDYRNGSRVHAVNNQSPYYNYYMAVSNRTRSNYNSKEIKAYLEEKRKLDQPIVQFNDNTVNAVHDTLNQS